MSEFLKWHPSSISGQKLYKKSAELSRLTYAKPFEGLNILTKEWKFGQVSELWDDYIFNTIIRKVLDQNQKSPDLVSIDRYSVLDHLLFLPYIRREEDPVRFRRAFWHVNAYGQVLSQYFSDHLKANNSFKDINNTSNNLSLRAQKKIAFVLKGPYQLAHVEFLHNFLDGCSLFKSKVDVHLILIDASCDEVSDLDHISIHSLSEHSKASFKLLKYSEYCSAHQFDHICWVACVQNLTLYMGMQLAPTQSYWSMKYHSIILPTIQKYAGLGFGGSSFVFDDVNWFRGRAFPYLSMPSNDHLRRQKLLLSKGIQEDSVLIGCFVRAEKLHSPLFWESISGLLNYRQNIHFVVASQKLPTPMSEFLASKLDDSTRCRFHHIGWVNTKEWCYCLDIYYDSSPRGSCNTIFEAIEAGVPILMADSSHNRESSALPYLNAAAASIHDLAGVPGVFQDEDERLKYCLQLVDNVQERKSLSSKQGSLLNSLKGRKYVFAKDYLNYFLDLDLSIQSYS